MKTKTLEGQLTDVYLKFTRQTPAQQAKTLKIIDEIIKGEDGETIEFFLEIKRIFEEGARS